MDVSITAASVRADAGTTPIDYLSGEAVTAGQVVYFDSAASTVKLADADALLTAAAIGIVTNSAPGSNQWVKVATGGRVTLNGLTVGQVYVASTTPGGIAPYADLASGDYVTILGVAETATSLILDPLVSGVAKP